MNESFDLPSDLAPMNQPGNNLPELSVTELSGAIKRTVEGAFERVRLRGEISRPTYARSGHLYLTLKDEKSVIDAVAWRGSVAKLSVRAEEGMEVIIEGRITTYPGSSKYQIVFDRLELAGEGALLKLLEDRKRKLGSEGLFDPERKRPLPYLPHRIGVVTSPTGAVLRDIIHRLNDRFPSHVLLWPVQVQGQGAAAMIAHAIDGFGQMSPLERPDLLIVARGGGSLEDLWCFNEEIVVRAAANCPIPLISAVGHETDTTLIDFASDVRAPTPSAAAELAVPVLADLRGYLFEQQGRLRDASLRTLNEKRLGFDGIARGLIHPNRRLEELNQTLDDWGGRLDGALSALVRIKTQALTSLDPARRLESGARQTLRRWQDQLDSSFGRLKALEQAEEVALKRGYARVIGPDGTVVTSAADFGDRAALTFHDGAVAVVREGQSSGDLPTGGAQTEKEPIKPTTKRAKSGSATTPAVRDTQVDLFG